MAGGNVLPKFNVINTRDADLSTVQRNLVRVLQPVFNTPTLGGNLLTSQTLATGANSINHGLGRNLNGWQIVRQRASANIWDSQDSNQTPNLTLALNSSAPVVVDIYCF
jgi:hypothetical protein